jgi:hypothetical protein
MTAQLQFFSVIPLSSLGKPGLRGDPNKLTIVFPQALAAHLKLSVDLRVDVALGRDRQRAAAIRISANPTGGYVIRKNGKSIQLRIPELACKTEAGGAAHYSLEPDGSVLIELPQPWELVDDRAISPQPAPARKPALAA